MQSLYPNDAIVWSMPAMRQGENHQGEESVTSPDQDFELLTCHTVCHKTNHTKGIPEGNRPFDKDLSSPIYS